MGVGFTLAFFIILTLANYWLSRSVLYPPLIFCMMWTFDLFVYCLHLVPMDKLDVPTMAIVAIGAFFFSLGGSLAHLVPRSLVRIRIVLVTTPGRAKSQWRSKTIKYLIIVGLAVGVGFSIHHLFGAAAFGIGDTFLSSARNAEIDALTQSDRPFSILTYIVPWSIYAAVLFSLERLDRPFWIMSGIAFIACLVSTGRTPFLFLFAALTGAYLLKTDRLSFLSALRLVKWPFLVFLLLFVGLIFTNKDTSNIGLGAGGVALLLVVNYIVGPLAAFNYFLTHQQEYFQSSYRTLKFVTQIAEALRLTAPAPVSYDQFVYVPFPHNVYTIYRNFIGDFGLYGMLCAMVIIGFLHALLYLKARAGSEFCIYLYSLSLYSVIMVTFDDQYSMLGFYVDTALFGAIYMLLRSLPVFSLPRILKKPQHSGEHNIGG